MLAGGGPGDGVDTSIVEIEQGEVGVGLEKLDHTGPGSVVDPVVIAERPDPFPGCAGDRLVEVWDAAEVCGIAGDVEDVGAERLLPSTGHLGGVVNGAVVVDVDVPGHVKSSQLLVEPRELAIQLLGSVERGDDHGEERP